MRDIVPGDALGVAWQIPWLAVFLTASCAAAAATARLLSDPANRWLRRTLLPGGPERHATG